MQTECSGFSFDKGCDRDGWSETSEGSHARLLDNEDEAELPNRAPSTDEVVAMKGVDSAANSETRREVSPNGADPETQQCQRQKDGRRLRSEQAQKVLNLRLDVDTRVYSPTQASRGRIRPGGHIGHASADAATASLGKT